MTPATFTLPDDLDTFPVNDTTKPDKWMVEMIRQAIMERMQEKAGDKPGSRVRASNTDRNG